MRSSTHTVSRSGWLARLCELLGRGGVVAGILLTVVLGLTAGASLDDDVGVWVDAWTSTAAVDVLELAEGAWALSAITHRNPTLLALTRELARRSPTVRSWLEEIRASGTHLTIGTFEDIYGGQQVAARKRESKEVWGLAVPKMIPDSTGALPVDISVFVQGFEENRKRLQRDVSGHDQLIEDVLRRELMMMLAHELAHAVEMARTEGEQSCEDPAEEGSLDGCVMKRENQVRRELGLPLNPGYGVLSTYEGDALVVLMLHRRLDAQPVMRELRAERGWSPAEKVVPILKSAGYKSWTREEVLESRRRETVRQASPPSGLPSLAQIRRGMSER